jgi:adenylosuccinate lyase
MKNPNPISPLDSRYFEKISELTAYFGDEALASYRVKAECHYLLALSKFSATKLRKFNRVEQEILLNLHKITPSDFERILQIEKKGYKNIKATNHDVKAIEYFIKDKLSHTSLKNCLEWVHFALTSEDINSMSYSMILSDSLEKTILPQLIKLHKALSDMAKKYAATPMLARTHGQPASPTTFGKEINVFAKRLKRQLETLGKTKVPVKFGGATGAMNAHKVAYPMAMWLKFRRDFIASLNANRKIKLELIPVTTQVEPHDMLAEIFDCLRRINTILIDFSQDIWRYISDGWIRQKHVKGEVGSSAMPHKVNPIDFENAEGNLGLANALFNFFSNKLPISRLQRDLSDSTVERNFGVAFGHSLLAYKSLMKGLSKIAVDEIKLIFELESRPEVISEAIQTILRANDFAKPYEQLQKLTQGKTLTLSQIYDFVNKLDIPSSLKFQLKKIKPTNYLGLSQKLGEMD